VRVGIVGAGFAGLSAAWDLARAGHETVVFDSLDRPGGLAAGFVDEGWDWRLEHFYHHLFLTDRSILGLADEIGFGREIMKLRPTSASFIRGRSRALDGVLPILRFAELPPTDRLRMGLVGLYLKLSRDWRRLETVTAEDWLRRWMGARATDVVWRPLLLGKFGPGHADAIPMSWLWARLHSRTFRLAYPRGGFQAFADRLELAVVDAGAEVRLGTRVARIEPAGGGLDLFTVAPNAAGCAGEGGRASGAPSAAAARATSTASHAEAPAARAEGSPERFDAVIVTAGPHILARMAPDLDHEYTARLRSLEHLGAVVAVLALNRQLLEDGTYWLNMDTREFPFLAVVEHTNLLPPRHYGGDRLVYVGHYLPPDHRYFGMTDEGVLDEWLPALARINPGFERRWVRRSWVWRAPYAQPVVPLGFSEHVPPLETAIPGLYLASMSQVYPWDRGTNYAVEIGRRVAARVLEGASGRRGAGPDR